MDKQTIVISEERYPVAWRFNAKDCSLSADEKEAIVFLNAGDSERLWGAVFPFDHLMEMTSSFARVAVEERLDFVHPEASIFFFRNKLKDASFVFFFWGRRAAAIVPAEILATSWSDFFYPDDETSVAVIANKGEIIFSHEERFFHARMIEQQGS